MQPRFRDLNRFLKQINRNKPEIARIVLIAVTEVVVVVWEQPTINGDSEKGLNIEND